MRGNRWASLALYKQLRTIPACAGEPNTDETVRLKGTDYPRVCGGTQRSLYRLATGGGLSPRVRGNRLSRLPYSIGQGTIPACAGEPLQSDIRKIAHRDYPRVCGGTPQTGRSLKWMLGLSPRVRGNRLTSHWARWRCGTIPACAGEPPVAFVGKHLGADYPRVCGGTSVRVPPYANIKGLSPRVRGNLWARFAYHHRQRTIPACAGEPSVWQNVHSGAGDYPRVCGGTPCAASPNFRGAGLSPRVRGNPEHCPAGPPGGGTIPACAGEPRARPGSGGKGRDYPRVCGGTAAGWYGGLDAGGLSPRVRGNPSPTPRKATLARTIPACAGEPKIRQGISVPI